MKRFLLLLFLSGLFALEISSIEITYGQPFEDGDTQSDIGLFLLNCDTKASVGLSFKIPLNENSALKYFIQYATYTKDIWENDYNYYNNVNLNFYNTGIKYHRNFKLKGRLAVHTSPFLGVMNTRTKSNILIEALHDIKEKEEMRLFWGYDLGASINMIEKISLIFNYSTILTELQDKNLLYQDLALGMEFKF
tara:strand:+ start:430 stop:1008 length:579 start_codon:yes stop_codon:yes gene_type:complete